MQWTALYIQPNQRHARIRTTSFLTLSLNGINRTVHATKSKRKTNRLGILNPNGRLFGCKSRYSRKFTLATTIRRSKSNRNNKPKPRMHPTNTGNKIKK
ncbi:MAG: hypothetical protein CMO80_14095 [Verrucomicrobiales bacterium]|nr:hypothetical protein [Verrucomicrobiales bacterium]